MTAYAQRWISKPPRGTLVDRSHPWVGRLGMQGFYALNEGCGGTIGDSLRNLNLATTGGPTWGCASQGGLVCAGTAGQVGAIGTLPASLRYTSALTVAVGFRPLGATVQYGGVAGIYPNNTHAAPYAVCAIDYGPTSRQPAGLYANSSSTSLQADGSSIASLTADTVSSFSITPTSNAFYANGVADGGSSGTSVFSYASSACMTIGYLPGASGFSANSIIYWLAWWNTVLSPAMHAAIGANVNAIWQVMSPAPTIAWFPRTPFSGQQTPILSVSCAPPTSAGIAYAPLCDNQAPDPSDTWPTSASSVWQPCPVSGGGVVDYLLVNTVSSCGGLYTFTLLKSSGGTVSVTSLSATPATTTGSDLTHSVAFSQGDLWCIQVTVAGGASSAGAVTWQVRFTAQGANQSLVLGGIMRGVGEPSNTAVNYGSLQGCAGNGAGTNGPLEIQPCGGTYKNLFVYVPTTVAAGSWSVALETGASAGGMTTASLAATISSGQLASDTTHSVAVTAGEYIGTVMTPAGAPTAETSIMWGLEFDPTVANQSIGTYDITNFTGPLTVFNGVSGSDCDLTGSQTTTANVIMGGVQVSNLYFANTVASTTGTVVATVMRNGAATFTVASVAVNGTAASDLTHAFRTADFDLLGVQTTYAGSGQCYPCLGVVFTYPSVAPNLVRRTLYDRAGSRGIA